MNQMKFVLDRNIEESVLKGQFNSLVCLCFAILNFLNLPASDDGLGYYAFSPDSSLSLIL